MVPSWDGGDCGHMQGAAFWICSYSSVSNSPAGRRLGEDSPRAPAVLCHPTQTAHQWNGWANGLLQSTGRMDLQIGNALKKK